jgi:hypothetical protein
LVRWCSRHAQGLAPCTLVVGPSSSVCVRLNAMS